jgi:hypothetical protein
VTLGSEVLCDGAISREEALGLAWQFEPLHAPLALTGGLVRILRAVIQVPVLAVFHAGQELAPGRLVALEFISDEHPWDILQPLEEFTEEFFGSSLVTPALHQDVEHGPVLVDGAPEIAPFSVNREEHFVQVPCVTWSGVLAPKLVSILLAKFPTPFPNRFVRDDDATNKEQLFNILVTEAEAEVQPDAMADDLGREAVVLVAVDGWYVHAASMSHLVGLNKLTKPSLLLRYTRYQMRAQRPCRARSSVLSRRTL